MKRIHCCKFPCRENRTRTCDHIIPNDAFYQLNYFSINYFAKIYIFFLNSKFLDNFFLGVKVGVEPTSQEPQSLILPLNYITHINARLRNWLRGNYRFNSPRRVCPILPFVDCMGLEPIVLYGLRAPNRPAFPYHIDSP